MLFRVFLFVLCSLISRLDPPWLPSPRSRKNRHFLYLLQPSASATIPQRRLPTTLLPPNPRARPEMVQRKRKQIAPVITARRRTSPAMTVSLACASPSWWHAHLTPHHFTARPCQRCIKRGFADNCTEGHRKKAKYLLDEEELGAHPSTSVIVCSY